jgi:hypothetical protein
LASLCLVRRRKLLCSCGNCAHGLAASAVTVQAHTRVAVFAALLALDIEYFLKVQICHHIKVNRGAKQFFF